MPRQLRWGVIGTANIGQIAVFPAIQRSRYGRIVSIASRNLEKARVVAAKFGIPRTAESYEALLADPDVDAIYLPLPNSLHAEWTVRSARAGKAVLCEKPLASTTADVELQIEACQKHGVGLMEAFMYRFHPQTARVLALIAEGAIGKVLHVHAHLSVNLLRDFDPANVRYHHDLGGGTLLDMSCYGVGLARMIFGAEPVRATGRLFIDPGLGVDTGAWSILEFPEGAATIASSFASDGNGSYSIVGSTGTIDVPRGFIPGLADRAGEALIIISDTNGRRREESFEPVDQYMLMADAFARAVLDRKPVPILPDDSSRNIRVLEALARSAAEGRTLSLFDP